MQISPQPRLLSITGLYLVLAHSSFLSAQSPAQPTPKPAGVDIATVSEGTPKGAPFVFADAPALPSLAASGLAETPAFTDEFSPGWDAAESGWKVATWKQNRTQMSRERVQVNADGHLVQTVLAGEPARGGSIQSTTEFGYGRWIARVRPSAVPGLLNSIFTKDWDDLTTAEPGDDGKKAEVDVEFVTHTFRPNAGEAHLAIHLPGKTPLWHLDIPLDFNPSDEFREWGFDILPDRVIWHVDGKVLYTWEYTETEKIDPNYEMFFNSWTRDKWLKGPPKEDANYHIDWVKFYPLVKQP